MSKNNPNIISLALINNSNIDLARIIITKADFRYDIKIDLFGESYVTYSYPLFKTTPIVNSPKSSNTNISYHYGKNDMPIVIHIKNLDKESNKEQYDSLPLRNIVPPSSLSVYPIPLMKMQFPSNLSRAYNHKKYHLTYNLEDDNVIEIYMAKSNYMFPPSGYEEMIYIMTPIEYFSMNSLEYPRDKQIAIKDAFRRQNELKAMRIYHTNIGIDLLLISYKFIYDWNNKDIKLTFLDNKYANEIIMNSIFDRPEEALDHVTKTYKYISMKPYDINDVLYKGIKDDEFVPDSVIDRMYRKVKDPLLKPLFLKLGLEAKNRLTNALKEDFYKKNPYRYIP